MDSMSVMCEGTELCEKWLLGCEFVGEIWRDGGFYDAVWTRKGFFCLGGCLGGQEDEVAVFGDGWVGYVFAHAGRGVADTVDTLGADFEVPVFPILDYVC